MSRDGGDSWKRLAGEGLPEGVLGKIGVAVAPSDSRRVYALIEAEKGGLFRSDDGGDKWSRVNDHRALQQRAWYYTHLTVDPANPDVCGFPRCPCSRRSTGARPSSASRASGMATTTTCGSIPKDPRRMINANDGGVEHQPERGHEL